MTFLRNVPGTPERLSFECSGVPVGRGTGTPEHAVTKPWVWFTRWMIDAAASSFARFPCDECGAIAVGDAVQVAEWRKSHRRWHAGHRLRQACEVWIVHDHRAAADLLIRLDHRRFHKEQAEMDKKMREFGS